MSEGNDIQDLISVIVPIYNTESFLNCCIESVLKQTYYNLELILVNDGSTDNSAEICNYYKMLDKRVKIIHKENGGQGSARNLGIEECKGKIIAFLDSDDYWDKDYLRSLYNIMREENSDIVVCAYQYVDEQNMKMKGNKKCTGVVENYLAIEAVQIMLYFTRFGVAPWSKLYKKELWNDIRFVEDRIYEDLATTYRIFEKAKHVTYIDTAYMNYRIRKGSDIHRPFEVRKMKTMDTAEEILRYTQINIPEAYKAAKSRMVATSFFILLQIDPYNKLLENERIRCEKQIKKYRFEVMLDCHSRTKTRVGALLSYLGFPVVRYIFRIVKRKNSLA